MPSQWGMGASTCELGVGKQSTRNIGFVAMAGGLGGVWRTHVCSTTMPRRMENALKNPSHSADSLHSFST